MQFDDLVRAAHGVSMNRWEAYYRGERRLDALGVTLPPEVRVLERTAPFPKLAVDVLAETLVPEGYTLDGDEETPRLLERWWQINDMDTAVHLGITEALVQGLSFFIVGYGAEDTPRITAHSRRGMAVDFDHMGEVRAAVRVWRDGDTEHAAHFRPGRTDYWARDHGRWRADGLSDEHDADRPAVVPVVNRARVGDVLGRSEIEEIAGVTDAASRTLTNLQVAQELLAMPVRYLFGDGLEALKDQRGNPVDKIEAYFGRYITGPSGAQAGSIPGASLQEFHNTYKLYCQEVSSITGIPPVMLGISTDNPSSADAMRTAKERLISKAEVKQAAFGDALEDLAKLALAMEGRRPENIDALQLHWRDPAKASASAKAAGLLQAHQQGIVSAQTARDGLSLSPAQKARENGQDRRSFARDQMLGSA